MAPPDSEQTIRAARIQTARLSRSLLDFLQLTEILGISPGDPNVFDTEVTMARLYNWGGPNKKEPK